MIRIKNLTVKNFMSIGNATQAVNFDRGDLTLVLGENLDLGSNGSRNGTGKTTLINALSYGLYGSALSEIKVNNLINKTNEKNMLVSIDFDIDGSTYRIERGRKPNLLKFYKDGVATEDKKGSDEEGEQQGDSRETQKEIEQLLGISHDMFKHTIALNTYTLPFLSMRTVDQRNIIEQLLGITVLTEKAEALKIANKATKEQINEEQFHLSAVLKANQHIEEQISNLERRQKLWQQKKDENINELTSAIETLLEVDIEDEIAKHKIIHEAKEQAKAEWYRLTDIAQKEYKDAMDVYLNEKDEIQKYNSDIDAQIAANELAVTNYNNEVSRINNRIAQLEKDQKNAERRMIALEKDIQLLDDHKCHACGQDLHDEKQEENRAAKWKELENHTINYASCQEEISEAKLQLAELGPPPQVNSMIPNKRIEPIIPVQATVDRIVPDLPNTYYKTVDEAHEHKSMLNTLSTQLETAINEEDPYAEQIIDMKEKGLQEVNYNEMNRLKDLQEHQAFLLKLLTNKDSFIRKKIIDQNLSYLNNRLTHYLREIGLPHQVRFMSDLSVEITDLGRDLDFDNLSRGERNRLILSLSWAFRDVWESLYNHINLLFVDELVDNGLDSNGVESAIKIMKGMARERGKSVWLVSHRDELISRVHNTMKVVKENGFTNYEGSGE